MNRNNIYTVNPLYNGSTTQTTEDGSVQSGGTTIIYQQGGGTGLTDAQKQKLDGIQEGAEVNQNAYSKVRLNGSDALIIEAKNKTDILNMSGVYPIAIAINGNGGLDFTVSSDQSNTNSVVTQSQLKAAIDQLEKDKYWKVDADGKLYTELDVYSHKEISAYGAGDGGGSTGGAGALYECADVLRDGDKVQGAAVGSILSYNGSHWYAIPQSAITPDLTNYATKSYVTQQINDLIGGAPGTLDTLKEIAEALGNNPNFATTVTEMINNIGLRVDQVEDRVVSLEDMFEWDKSASASDPSLWRIKAKKDLYGVGEISAYGYSSGTVPTGAQYMYELKDVLFTELTSGQLLQWNGTKWINIDKNTVGLNETELAKYLTNNNYAKKSDITWANLLNKPTTWGWANITGKPTTLAGYGITDGVPNTRRVSAGNGLAGGGVLSSDVTISLGTIGTAGTYTKITTDMYGRVVSGTTLSESDIPTLQISKISGLQSALDSKLNISDFNTWFTINRDTSGNIVSIQANYNLFSVGEVSAYGLGGTQPSITTLAGLDDVNISNPQNKQALIYDSASGKWINGASVAGGNISLNGTVYEAVDGLITLPNLVDIAGDQVITGTKTFKAAGNLKFGTSTNGITLAVDSGKLAVANYANSTHAGIQASFFKKVSGTSSQFLKADGSVDGNLYALAYNGNQNKVLESNVSNSLHVIDRRESSPAPTDFEARTISTFFNLNNMPSGTWWSGISVSGWSNVDYVTWQLAGPSSTNNPTANLRFRTGIGSSWNEWKMILDKDYADGLYVKKTGDTMTGPLIIDVPVIPANPSINSPTKIGFKENGAQEVAFAYTDFDSYRPPAGIKLVSTENEPWFEAAWILGRKLNMSRISTEYSPGTGAVLNYLGTDTIFDGQNSVLTGIMKIRLPVNWSNTMGVYKIMIYEYNGRGSSEITISFYNYSSSESYYNYSYQLNGAFEGEVRIAHDGSGCCILLGDTAYTWNYPKVYMYQVFGGQNVPSSYVDQSFNLSIITSTSGLTKITPVPKTSMNRHDDNYIRAINKNGYYGMGKVGNIDTDWIRTAKPGLIPFEPGSHSGNSFLGTESWQFGKIFGAIIYGQRVCSLNHNLYLGSSGNSGWVYCQDICSANGAAEAYWSIRTNGSAVFTNLTSKNKITGDISGSAAYFPTAYIRGTQANPQTYFNQNMGLRVAMTGIGFGGPWSDTLWINGYSGNDVLPMCALHFIRNGTPRFGISTQNSNGTSYGTNYEVWTAYNSNKDGVNWSAQTFFSSIGLKSRNICIETDNSGNDGGCSSEINNWNSHLFLQEHSNTFLYACRGGGNFVIGTVSSDYKLNVGGDIIASSWIRTSGATGWYSQSYGGGIYMTDSDQVQVYNNKILYNTGVRAWGIGGHHCGIKLYNQHHIGFNLANAKYTWGIYSNSDGNMYIGRRNGDVNNTTGSYIVTITGSTLSVTGSVVASGEVTAYSDARLKSNIHTLDYRGRLIPRHYVKDGKQSIGFIAQEVQTLYPELVLGYDKSRPYLSLNYNGCTAVLSAQLNHVEDEVTMLKNKVRELEIKVSVLTEQLHSQAI